MPRRATSTHAASRPGTDPSIRLHRRTSGEATTPLLRTPGPSIAAVAQVRGTSAWTMPEVTSAYGVGRVSTWTRDTCAPPGSPAIGAGLRGRLEQAAANAARQQPAMSRRIDRAPGGRLPGWSAVGV